jgi:hypothetical protein
MSEAATKCRIPLVPLIITSFVAVQAASAIEIFPDHRADDRRCAGGHAGHFPWSPNTVQIATSVAGWHAGAN